MVASSSGPIKQEYPTTDDMTFRVSNTDQDGTWLIRIYGEFD